MNKIKKAFLNYVVKFDKGNIEEDSNYRFEDFEAGYKSANPLPTTKVCPECDENGYYIPQDGIGLKGIYKCPNKNCKNGIIQIYYTPEEYKEITGKDLDWGSLVWYYVTEWNAKPYNQVKAYFPNTRQYIVQTAQKCPGADYRREG